MDIMRLFPAIFGAMQYRSQYRAGRPQKLARRLLHEMREA
jgi:hypothetical protein